MQADEHPFRPGHSRTAWGLYVTGLVALLGFLVVPYSEIRTYPSWEEDLGANGWRLMGEAWELVSAPAGPFALPFTVSLAFGLLTAFSVVCALPTAGLLWFGGHSRAILWLGRIWWSLMILPGFAWFFLLENALRAPGAIEYLHRPGMLCYWIGGLGMASAFWVTGRRDRGMEIRVEGPRQRVDGRTCQG